MGAGCFAQPGGGGLHRALAGRFRGNSRQRMGASVAESNSRKLGQGNQAEVAEFILSGQSLGINGSKIKQIVPYEPDRITRPPINHPSLAGVYMYRGNNVPLIKLNSYLEMAEDENLERRVVLVTEFNEMTTAFIADKVVRIHRLPWTELKPLSEYLSQQAPQIIGSITIEDREILVLDLEQIVGEIFPESVVNYDEHRFEGRADSAGKEEVKIYFAEDSYIIRTQLSKVLASVGYDQVTGFGNGLDAYNAIKEISEEAQREGVPLSTYINLLISDIEMPQMDGLVLCHKIKKQLNLDIPVLMFSSLINEQVANKCREAGADNWVSKPQTGKLIDLVESMTSGK